LPRANAGAVRLTTGLRAGGTAPALYIFRFRQQFLRRSAVLTATYWLQAFRIFAFGVTLPYAADVDMHWQTRFFTLRFLQRVLRSAVALPAV